MNYSMTYFSLFRTESQGQREGWKGARTFSSSVSLSPSDVGLPFSSLSSLKKFILWASLLKFSDILRGLKKKKKELISAEVRIREWLFKIKNLCLEKMWLASINPEGGESKGVLERLWRNHEAITLLGILCLVYKPGRQNQPKRLIDAYISSQSLHALRNRSRLSL